MKSNLTLVEFRARLEANLKMGSPKHHIPWGFFSIFGTNSKCFYGKYDSTTFELTKNSNFTPNYYFIQGSYHLMENQLLINYSLLPNGRLRNAYLTYFPYIIFFLLNSLFYFSLKPPTIVYIIFNLFLLIISLLMRLTLKFQRKKLMQKFETVFEITA